MDPTELICSLTFYGIKFLSYLVCLSWVFSASKPLLYIYRFTVYKIMLKRTIDYYTWFYIKDMYKKDFMNNCFLTGQNSRVFDIKALELGSWILTPVLIASVCIFLRQVTYSKPLFPFYKMRAISLPAIWEYKDNETYILGCNACHYGYVHTVFWLMPFLKEIIT